MAKKKIGKGKKMPKNQGPLGLGHIPFLGRRRGQDLRQKVALSKLPPTTSQEAAANLAEFRASGKKGMGAIMRFGLEKMEKRLKGKTF